MTLLLGAPWQWSVWRDDAWLGGLYIYPENAPGRAWMLALFSPLIDDISPNSWGPRLIAPWRDIAMNGPWSEIRTWLSPDDPVSIRFAERCGFYYDCGPATGIGTDGKDYQLHLWRRDNDITFQRRRRGSGKKAGARGPNQSPEGGA